MADKHPPTVPTPAGFRWKSCGTYSSLVTSMHRHLVPDGMDVPQGLCGARAPQKAWRNSNAKPPCLFCIDVYIKSGFDARQLKEAPTA